MHDFKKFVNSYLSDIVNFLIYVYKHSIFTRYNEILVLFLDLANIGIDEMSSQYLLVIITVIKS